MSKEIPGFTGQKMKVQTSGEWMAQAVGAERKIYSFLVGR